MNTETPTIDTFIKAVRHACVDNDWSNMELCREAGISTASWGQIKSKRQAPTSAQLARLQKACKLPENQIPTDCKRSRRTIKTVNFVDTNLMAFAEKQARVRFGGNFSQYINYLVKLDTEGGQS